MTSSLVPSGSNPYSLNLQFAWWSAARCEIAATSGRRTSTLVILPVNLSQRCRSPSRAVVKLYTVPPFQFPQQVLRRSPVSPIVVVTAYGSRITIGKLVSAWPGVEKTPTCGLCSACSVHAPGQIETRFASQGLGLACSPWGIPASRLPFASRPQVSCCSSDPSSMCSPGRR